MHNLFSAKLRIFIYNYPGPGVIVLVLSVSYILKIRSVACASCIIRDYALDTDAEVHINVIG